VHFHEDDTFADHSAITVQCISDNKINVHLGFLKLRHRYECCFSIARKLSLTLQTLPSLYVKLIGIECSGDGGTNIKVEFFAYQERLLKETLILQDGAEKENIITLILNARVLGEGKGTPSLKSGIRCIDFEPSEESEASDWQGFD